MRKTINDIAARKGSSSQPLVCLTAYTAPVAKAFDPHCDILLVGDSVAMVLYGEPSTLQADMEMMIRHGRAVTRATEKALVVVDMPFGSYQESKEAAFRNAARILKETGAASVKLEGGTEMAETIAYLSRRGIPVVGHIGLQPQSVNATGYKTQGRSEDSARKILNDAKAVADAGAFAIVVEGVAESLADDITRAVNVPTIGIGASARCDGQILVADDMLGMTTGHKPKFVKAYADLAALMGTAAADYAREVRARTFPQADNVYASQNVPVAPPAATPKPALELEVVPDEKPEAEPRKSAFENIVLRARRPSNYQG
jgi:3-methyl-2-oxobutanoate hydroxymethyltransferase